MTLSPDVSVLSGPIQILLSFEGAEYAVPKKETKHLASYSFKIQDHCGTVTVANMYGLTNDCT